MKKIMIYVLAFITLTSAFYSDDSQKIELLSYGGLPLVENQEVKVLYNTAFITGYSEKMKNPLWTVYRLGNMQGNYSENGITKWERTRGFKVDNRTVAKVSHEDYTGSGYDRGHMAPNSGILVQYGQMAQLETFFMSNICPQSEKLNRGIWQKLEQKVRTEISQDDTKDKEIQDVYVITGPIFGNKDNSDKLASGVAIPTSFYKILVYQRGYFGTPKAVAFCFPQKPEYTDADDLLKYVTTVDAIEDSTGLNFYPMLSETKQRNLESKKRNFQLEDIVD